MAVSHTARPIQNTQTYSMDRKNFWLLALVVNKVTIRHYKVKAEWLLYVAAAFTRKKKISILPTRYIKVL